MPKKKIDTAEETTHEITTQQEPQENFEYEFFDNVKESLFDIASMPLPQAGDKRKKLRDKLYNDKFLQKYVDKKIKMEYFKFLNIHLKAGLIYGYHVANTLNTL